MDLLRSRNRVAVLAACVLALALAALGARALSAGGEPRGARAAGGWPAGPAPTTAVEGDSSPPERHRDAPRRGDAAGTGSPSSLSPLPASSGAPVAMERWAGPGHAVAVVRPGRSVLLRRRPGGRALKRVGARTEFGSPRTLAVQRRLGFWLGVSVPERPNGQLAWVDGRSRALSAARTRLSLHADLSDRTLELRRGGRVLRRLTVAIGRPANPTPPGRFSVTDKIDGRPYGGTYGCCILALSGHQPALPPGWPGGDRLAVHGTTATARIGAAASTGCLRARDEELRPLMRRLALGTPVFIRP